VKIPSKALGVKIPAPYFIIFKLQDPKKSTSDINLFYVQIAVDGHADKVRDATLLKNWTLLVEVFSENKQRLSVGLMSSVLILLKLRDTRSSYHPEEL
jgi:hypothetical protein